MASKARDLSNFISTAAIDASEIGTGAITTDKIADTTITHAKLHTTMDLSGKTVTLPTINALDVTNNINVGGTVDGVDIQTLNTTAGAALPKAGGTLTGGLGIGAAPVAGDFEVHCASGGELRVDNYGASGVLIKQLNGGSGTSGSMMMQGGTNIILATNDTVTALTLDASQNAIFTGNVGIGVVPETDWYTGYHVIQLAEGAVVGGYVDNSVYLGSNWKDDANNKYINTDEASVYKQSAGRHIFQVAPSGSADAAMTMTNAMMIDNSGNVGIGNTAPAGKLHVAATGTASLASATINEVSDFSASSRVGFSGLPNNNDGMYFGMGVDGGISAGMGFFREASGWNSALTFYTNNQTSGAYGVDAIQEQMRITSAGDVEIKNGGDLVLYNSGNTVSSRMWVDTNESGMGTDTANYITMNALNLKEQATSYGREWSDYPSITIRNNTTYGAQGEYRIHGINGISGGDFSVLMRCDGGYITGSDSRRKTNITEITGAIDTVKQLSGKSFNITNKEGDIQDNISSETTGKKYGFIAQDTIGVIPEAVIFHEDENTPLESGWASAYAIDYASVVPLLTNAIKEQQVMIDDLIARITTLEA